MEGNEVLSFNHFFVFFISDDVQLLMLCPTMFSDGMYISFNFIIYKLRLKLCYYHLKQLIKLTHLKEAFSIGGFQIEMHKCSYIFIELISTLGKIFMLRSILGELHFLMGLGKSVGKGLHFLLSLSFLF